MKSGRICLAASIVACLHPNLVAQRALTWPELRDRFEASNPVLLAARASVDESRAQEITAYLRPNPDYTLQTDGTQLVPYRGVWQPLAGTQVQNGVSYLHEREHKRELRRESSEKATAIAESQLADQRRTLLFNLHNAFVQTLQQKAVLALTNENLAHYDKLLGVSRDRFKAGDIAKVDLTRLELQRVQFQTDVQTATVNLRTAKIQLLTLLNDRTPVELFDVDGPFDFSADIGPLEGFRKMALEARPDLRAAMETIDKARTDHQLAVANGSADPTFSAWVTHNPSFNNPNDNTSIGASVSFPLRIFDRNQGEKLRTQLEIGRMERLRDASVSQVFGDVDSAYETLNGNLTLLRPYRQTYLRQAVEVRDTVSFSYQHGGASLLDFLQAQQDFRSLELNYLNLIGAFLTSANQLNLAVGREVIQ